MAKARVPTAKMGRDLVPRGVANKFKGLKILFKILFLSCLQFLKKLVIAHKNTQSKEREMTKNKPKG